MDLENDTFIVKTDSGELCRLCANTDNQLIPIFKGEGIEHNISSKIEKHLPIIKVTEQDKLPLQICYQCASTLIAWHNLYEGCRIADNRLREILSIDEKLPQYMKDDESLENYTDDFRDDYEEESQNNFVENVQLASISNSSQLNEVQTLGNTEINEHTDTKIFDETENENHNDERRHTNAVKKAFQCILCSYCVGTKQQMKIHIENIHGLFDYAVEQNNGTVKKISYQTRIQCKNNQNLTDDTISKIENVKVVSSFVKYETPKEEFHIEETAEGQPRWVCLLCKVNFSLRSNLEIHVKKYHVSDEDESGTLKILRRGYCCDVCGCGLHNIDYLAAHRFSLHPEAKHLQWHKLKSCVDTVKLCLICMKYFRYGESFKRHFCVNEVNYKAVEKVRKALNVEPSFMCDICSQCFKWKFSYQYHREIEHKGVSSLNWEIIEPEKIEYYCKTCLKGFHEAYVLREHDCSSAKYEPKSMQKFQCEICEKLFGSKFSLRRHKRMTHERKITPPIFDVNRSTKPKGPTIKCPFCDIMFTSGKVVLSHVKDVHHQVLETPYFCVPCSKPFSIHSTLQIHNHLYHGTKEEPEELQRICKEAEITHKGTMAYECKTCYRIFDDSYKYIIHYRWHRADRKFTCERCGKRKTTRTQLNEHIRKEHENKSKKFDCDICGKTLSTKCALQGHLAVHKGEKSYTCEICGLTFVSMNRLLNHKAVHNEYVRLYHCNICLKGFKKRVLLKDHMHQHTGEKNVPCPVCGKKFATKTHVYYHKKRVHANVRPFECALCGLSFVIKSNLKRHVNLHMINPGMIVRRRNLSNKKHAVNCKSENV